MLNFTLFRGGGSENFPNVEIIIMLIPDYTQFLGENGKRECLHCNIPQTGCKHGYIKHIAHEHPNVVEELAAESIYGDIQEEERKKIEPNNELHDQDLD